MCLQSAEGLLGFDGSANSSKTQLVPQALRNLDKHTIVQIACGDDHFLALTSTGLVFACGNGEQHQLGRKIIQRALRSPCLPSSLLRLSEDSSIMLTQATRSTA